MIRLYKSFWAVPVVLLCMAGLAPFTGARADDAVFTVENVHVDVTAENATKAREKAFEQAEQDAFATLAGRLTPDARQSSFTPPDVSVISPMIQDFEIVNEQLSAVRYVGTYTFRFKDGAVRNYFSVSDVSYTDVVSKPVLILPFFQWGSRMLLWDDGNPWLAAWKRSNGKPGLVPVSVPIGDLDDMGDIDGSHALTYEPNNLDSMLRRYETGEAVILIAIPETSPDGRTLTGLSVNMYRTDGRTPQFVQTLKQAVDPGVSTDGFYDSAVMAVRKALQENWKEQTATSPASRESRISARMRFSSMQEWVTAKAALAKVSGIGDIDVVSLTPREALIEIPFRGDENLLRLALAQQDIGLNGPEPDTTGSAPVYDLYLNPAPGGN